MNRRNRRAYIPSLKKRNKRRLIRTSLVVGNVCLLVVVSIFVLSHRSASQTVRRNSSGTAVQTVNSVIQNPLDQLSSAEIAAQAAQLAGLPETIAVRNQADSENAQLAVIPSDTTIVAKPQIVSTAQRSKKNILKVKITNAQPIAEIAARYGVTSDSIKWSNGLSGDTAQAGVDLVIPPANGIVVQVKAGDTIDSLVSKYRAERNLFVTVNDAESGTLVAGEYVWLPNGQQPVVVSSYSRYSGFSWGGYSAVYSGNGYDYGWCTWWAAKRRADVGRPLPSNLGNAYTWKSLAARSGLPVSGTPVAGAVAYYESIGGLGHVGFVETVNSDGSAWISDMNYFGVSQIGGSTPAGGWGRASYHLVPAGGMGAYSFIY